MSAKGMGRGCFGDLVNMLQVALQQPGFPASEADW